MLILGIETSCDETAAAVIQASGDLVKPRFQIRSNVVSSQVKLHAKYGGVVPVLAAREHEKNLPIVTNVALKQQGASPILTQKPSGKTSYSSYSNVLKNIRMTKINLIAVTKGPGLAPCLWRGINFAQQLSADSGIRILGVNHLEGHIYSNWLAPIDVESKFQNKRLPEPSVQADGRQENSKFENRKIEFPAICLIVSGGHTELILMKNHGAYESLGATRDDAVGEAYDKVARLLGLGFPGGPLIDKLACSSRLSPVSYPVKLPRPMINSKNYDFSFAGLKTAVLYLLRDLKLQGKTIPKQAIAAEFQAAATEVLVAKTLRASREYGAKTIMVSGGVAANSGLRRAFGKQAFFPPKALSTDNAAMIAIAGYIRHKIGERDNHHALTADANLEIPYN